MQNVCSLIVYDPAFSER